MVVVQLIPELMWADISCTCMQSPSHLEERGAEQRHGVLVEEAGAPLQQGLALSHEQVPEIQGFHDYNQVMIRTIKDSTNRNLKLND